MLKGIPSVLSPELLKILDEMGHGDEIILSDAHFPAHSIGIPVLRADGIPVAGLLQAILPLLELDAYVEHPVTMMAPVPGDSLDESLMTKVYALVTTSKIEHMERYAFYDRARKAFAVVVTGETTKYGNILLKKGVTPCL